MAERATALLTAERRQVTALFCDLVDSTALSQRLDAEDFHDTMRRFRDCCAAVVGRYQGHIAEYLGDGCLVLFGYPRAHEDAPARAIRTGLDLAMAIGNLSLAEDRRITARIGIATGVIVVEPGAPEGSIVGESVNLAARLQSAARPGEVVVAELTRELAGGMFDFESLGPLDLKGFANAVPAWRAVRPSAVTSRFEALRTQMLTPFVGRRAELQTLGKLWRRACDGRFTTVLLSGEAGIGKSRLLRELQGRIAGSAGEVLRFHCSPYHTNTALYPFIEACGRMAVTTNDSPSVALMTALRQAVEPLGPEWQQHLPGLAQLLSMPVDPNAPRQSKQQIMEALGWWLRGLARQGPLVALLEDAHWIDPTSLELLELAVGSLGPLPLLLVITTRTDLGVRWKPRAEIRTIALDRLSADDARTLIGKVDKAGRLDRSLVARIAANADGVPLFIEELTRTAIEQEQATAAARGGLPATLRDSLLLRLEQLDGARTVAQVAAVIGREFATDLLAEVADIPAAELGQKLLQLGSRGFVYPTAKSGGENWAFKHGLVREAAYESVLKQDRRQLHARVAAALERRLSADNIGQPEILAHHYTEAGAIGPALRNWALAAQQAYRRSANLEVIGHAGRALALLEGLPPSPERDRGELQLQLLLGAAYWATKGFASLEVERAFTRAIELAMKGTPGAAPVEVMRGLYGCYYARGELSSAWRQAEQVAQAARHGARGDRMVVHLLFGQTRFWRGEFAEARAELEAALAVYDPAEQRQRPMSMQIDPAVNARMHLGWTLWMLGHPDQALSAVETATVDARHANQPFSLAMALFWEAVVKGCCGRIEQSRAVTAELRAVTREHEIAYLGACATVLEGGGLIARGDVDAGLLRLRRAFIEFGRQQAGLGWPWALSLAISGCACSGRTAEGRAMLREATTAMQRHGERMWEAELHRLEAELQAGEPDLAAMALERALAAARRQGALSLELRAAMSLARLRGDKATLAQTLARFSEGLDTADLRAARELLA